MPRASTTTCATATCRRRRGRPSPASRPGCGATARCRPSSTGSAPGTAAAEAYYRAMYDDANESWNLRDRHMFVSLQRLLEFHGEGARAVVWAHNSHVGDASATEMAARGEWNIGQLCRQEFGEGAFLL